MSRHAWIREAGIRPLFGQRIAVADAAGLDLDPYRAFAGLGDFSVDDLERSIRTRDLHGAHLGHDGLAEKMSTGFFRRLGARLDMATSRPNWTPASARGQVVN